MKNWILFILIIIMIIKEIRILIKLVIKTKKTAMEIIFLIAGIGVLFYITYKYAQTPIHYLLGVLGITLYVVSYLTTGITSSGIASLYRGAKFVSWNKIDKVQINIGKSTKIIYSGSSFSNSMYFKNEDSDKIIKFLNEKLPDVLVDVDYEPNAKIN
ncbi:hypothetical protein [Clostridium tetani]|uniref:hypothetical protein n=1 Tax=Clostridium tetani TaxID=1513 RepID=UPI000514875F|nr:hypothetical protein [Clostridium tetani]KGI39980.1 hypothetical protein LA33_04665 [Clostridium tetani ATCC 9441]SUY66512.1 Uncharacterised protein [Clostridium tetani]